MSNFRRTRVYHPQVYMPLLSASPKTTGHISSIMHDLQDDCVCLETSEFVFRIKFGFYDLFEPCPDKTSILWAAI